MRDPARAAARLRFAAESVVGHTDYTRFIVLGHARTGSNMLLSMLNSHPAVFARGEVFARVTPDELHAAVVGEFGRRLPRRITAAGCKVFYYHPLRDPSGQLWRELEPYPLRVVHLRRRNVLRTVVSRAIAEQREQWLQTRPSDAIPAELRRVSMTADEIRGAVERIRTFEREAADLLPGKPLLDVTYEDLVDAPDVEFRRVTDFLHVPFQGPQASTLRQNPEPLAQLLVDYDALRAAFAATDLAPFFD